MSAVGSEKTEQILQLKGHSCPFVMLSQGEAELSGILAQTPDVALSMYLDPSEPVLMAFAS